MLAVSLDKSAHNATKPTRWNIPPVHAAPAPRRCPPARPRMCFGENNALILDIYHEAPTRQGPAQ
eukprot:4555416-Pleurochrysis_carterae.AAC.1